MKAIIIAQTLKVLMSVIDTHLMKQAIDAMLDKIEDKILQTSTQYDDMFILPLLRTLRQAINVPDDD